MGSISVSSSRGSEFLPTIGSPSSNANIPIYRFSLLKLNTFTGINEDWTFFFLECFYQTCSPFHTDTDTQTPPSWASPTAPSEMLSCRVIVQLRSTSRPGSHTHTHSFLLLANLCLSPSLRLSLRFIRITFNFIPPFSANLEFGPSSRKPPESTSLHHLHFFWFTPHMPPSHKLFSLMAPPIDVLEGGHSFFLSYVPRPLSLSLVSLLSDSRLDLTTVFS